MKEEALKQYLSDRIELVFNNEITYDINYSNGILFHAIPNELYYNSLINWENEEFIKNALSNMFINDMKISKTDNGCFCCSKNGFVTLKNNGIIEAFLPKIVKQTPINFPPKIRYVQVENVVSHFQEFINCFKPIREQQYDDKTTFTVFISLIGIKGVVFNATERDYTTSLVYPKNTLTFQVNESKLYDKEEVEEAIHKTLYEFEPII